MAQVDFTMTSVLRPALFDETLSTIQKNILEPNSSHDYRLILNVDPVGEDVPPKMMVRTARKYFENIVYNIPEEPSFPKAVKWAWSQVEAPYVFHWEDDVFIWRPIDVNHMMGILDKYKEVSSLRLFKHDTAKAKAIHTFDSVWDYHKDGFYIARGWQKQFGLNPIFLKLEFVQEAAGLLREDYNPEKQFRYNCSWMVPLIKKWKYGLYTKPGEGALVWGRKGAAWKKKHGLIKGKGGGGFINWVKRK